MPFDSAVVLSGSIGKGHDSVAEACEAALQAVGVSSEVLDCMSMLGGARSRLGTSVFRRMISLPALYDGFHFSYLRNGNRVPQALAQQAVRQLLPSVASAVAAAGSNPLVVSVFPTGVCTVAALKRERPTLAAVAVCTDATAHRMWVAEGTDLYVVCSPVGALTVKRYAPGAAVAVIPPPVRPQFYDVPAKSAARAGLGVAPDERCVLLMGGGWGLGPLDKTAEALAGAGYWVLAVAGANGRLYARLRAVASRHRRVLPFAMTNRVHELMAAADAVVTSPGQTCHEARAVGRWLVVLDVVPGHGRENALHELEQGGALACSPEPASVEAAVEFIFAEQPEHPPWPVRSAVEWEKQFLGAMGSVGFEFAEPAGGR
ncbi:MAG: glycosyl hydrolase [Actinomycetota bacterium]|nr:glycosyl hydrolase [Actinomycetota bacterium]